MLGASCQINLNCRSIRSRKSSCGPTQAVERLRLPLPTTRSQGAGRSLQFDEDGAHLADTGLRAEGGLDAISARRISNWATSLAAYASGFVPERGALALASSHRSDAIAGRGPIKFLRASLASSSSVCSSSISGATRRSATRPCTFRTRIFRRTGTCVTNAQSGLSKPRHPSCPGSCRASAAPIPERAPPFEIGQLTRRP